MSELKATPGPWLVATSCSWRRIINERGKPVCIPTIQHSDNHPDMEFPNGGPEGPDASLMIAAPELFDCLDSFPGFNSTPEEFVPWTKRVVEVLAKAKGEQP